MSQKFIFAKPSKEDLSDGRGMGLSSESTSSHSNYCHLSQPFAALPWNSGESLLTSYWAIECFLLLFTTARAVLPMHGIRMCSCARSPSVVPINTALPSTKNTFYTLLILKGPAQLLLLPRSFSSCILGWGRALTHWRISKRITQGPVHKSLLVPYFLLN